MKGLAHTEHHRGRGRVDVDCVVVQRQERIDRAAHRKQRQKKRYGKQYTDDELAKFQEELSSKGFTLRESKGDGW